MDESWNKAKQIFAEALKLPPAERVHFLDDACDNDAEIRREVESLLNSLDDAGSFMEQPAGLENASLTAQNKVLEKGKRFGHYEIVRPIGAGGMGEVYLANDTRLERPVAIKILNHKFSREKANLDRFVKEAKAASSLNHPNILVIHEIGLSDEANYIVSEYIEGKTLRDVIGGKTLTLPESLDIAVQIANAISAAHTANIVHRDIKPENIIVRPDGFVKILDFGLAKLINQQPAGLDASTVKHNQTAKGMILGTVNYMSPEQAKGEKIDARTDIFSFGALIYEMIAGRTPFAGDSMSETFANLINAEPPPLSRFAGDIPAELERIVSKTLRKKKDERYQTMKDVLGDLKDLRENLAFGERLERAHSPEPKNSTAGLPAITDELGQISNPTQKTFTGPFKRNMTFGAIVIALLFVGSIGLAYYFWPAQKSAATTSAKRSLAVLPFVNASTDPNTEYLSDGVTESIINSLSQLSNLKVMSRNSAFRFKSNQTDTKTIGAQLGVETLVTGDIKQLGDKIIINVRLINASDDSQIWGSQYVKNSGDVLAAQNEIARAVAQNLRLRLSATEEQKIAKRPTENTEAYQLYLRGRFHVFKVTPTEIQKGISYFQQAIELDPNYALAYAGLADAYRSLAIGSEMSPTEFFPKSKAAALRALELDDSLADGYATLGMTLMWGEWNWSGAEDNFKRAIELDPNGTNGHLLYAHLLSNLGRHAEALAEVKLAREIEPLFAFAGALEGQLLNHAGRQDEALDRLQKTLELAPTFWMPHIFASSVYTEKGMYSEAVAEARKAKELSPTQTVSEGFGGYALAKLGKSDEARVMLDELLKLSKTRFVPANHIALIYNGLGETDKTFEWLEKAYNQRDPKMSFLKVEPKWNNLRSDPRFIVMIERLKFP